MKLQKAVRMSIPIRVAILAAPWPCRALPISLGSLGTPYTQDFNSLASSGKGSSLPTGWALSESGANADTQYNAGTGSSNAGDTYSFGSTRSSDRALGALRSANLVPLFGAEFRNDTGSTISSLAIAYTGEMWRLGATNRQDRLDFQYSLDATSLTNGTWLDFDALDFLTPNSSGSVGNRNGNATENRTALLATLALTLPADATFWLRWTDFDATGSDDGLAVDDFSLVAWGTPTASVPESGHSVVLLALALISLAMRGRLSAAWNSP
jgi:hypothetical protein